MTRSIIAILFIFLGLNISTQASQEDEPSNVNRASIALRNLADKPTLERLTSFNNLASTLTDEELTQLDSRHLHKVLKNPSGYDLAGAYAAVALGMVPAIQEELKQSLILWAKLVNYIPDGTKNIALNVCATYKAWYNNEHSDASAAISSIRAHYNIADDSMPVWQLYGTLPLQDKILFHITTMYSLPASNVYIRWTTISFFAVMAYLYFR
jgi:hypothetical protein